ncbi:MAG: RnfABCDGE type electron transport complex subunit D [Treponema sp.]|jgi:electron transport complex protein RnfD|nr:RnfABCDGE type electron transport complex subunit D [Treponema sp.]
MREKRMPDQKPQVNVSRPTAGRMWLVCFCAGLAIVQSGLTDSGASLIVALTALISAVLTELLFTYKSGGLEKIKDGSAAASALVFSLLLPNHIHPLYAGLGAVFAMAVVKHSFGGLGSNWVNPSLGGWLFVRYAWPASFDRALAGSPFPVLYESLRGGFSDPQGSPLGILKISGFGLFSGAASPLDGTVTSFLNRWIFSIAGAELPAGYMDLLISRAPGIIADRGLLALLLGTVIITASRVSRSWVPAVYLGFFGFLVRMFGALPFGGLLGDGDIFFGFFSGGTMAAAFLLASDPATGAKSRAGILAAVILGALLSWFFRYQGFAAYGAFFAAALINALTPLIRSFERWLLYVQRRRLSV